MYAQELRAILKKIFQDRREKNPRYTLTAFARDLEVRPAQLSLILSGKRGLPPQMAKTFAKRLRLPARLARRFLCLADAVYSRSHSTREKARRALLRPLQTAVARCEEVFYLFLTPAEATEILADLRQQVRTWISAPPSGERREVHHELEIVLLPRDALTGTGADSTR